MRNVAQLAFLDTKLAIFSESLGEGIVINLELCHPVILNKQKQSD